MSAIDRQASRQAKNKEDRQRMTARYIYIERDRHIYVNRKTNRWLADIDTRQTLHTATLHTETTDKAHRKNEIKTRHETIK